MISFSNQASKIHILKLHAKNPWSRQKLYIHFKNNDKRFAEVFSQRSHKSNPISATPSGFMMFNHRNKHFYGQVPSLCQGFFLHILKQKITQPLWRFIANFALYLKLSRVVFLSTLAFLSLSLRFLIHSTH